MTENGLTVVPIEGRAGGDVWYFDIHNLPEGAKIEVMFMNPSPDTFKTNASADQKIVSINFQDREGYYPIVTLGESTRTSMLGTWW